MTGCLLWIGKYCISCVDQQRSRVKDLSFLVGYVCHLGEIRLVKSIKGIQSLVKEICKITRSKSNCQRLQHEIHFILYLSKIDSRERKKIARKHRYSSFDYCEMETLKKEAFSVKEKRKQAGRGIDFCIEQCKNKIRKGPCYICCVCNRLLYKRSVHIFGKNIGVKFFSVCSIHLVDNSMFVKHVT